MRKVDPKSFCNSSYRHVTHATICVTVEVRNLAKTIKSPKSLALLLPAGGDKCDRITDNKEVLHTFETAFEPAGELEVEEGLFIILFIICK